MNVRSLLLRGNLRGSVHLGSQGTGEQSPMLKLVVTIRILGCRNSVSTCHRRYHGGSFRSVQTMVLTQCYHSRTSAQSSATRELRILLQEPSWQAKLHIPRRVQARENSVTFCQTLFSNSATSPPDQGYATRVLAGVAIR